MPFFKLYPSVTFKNILQQTPPIPSSGRGHKKSTASSYKDPKPSKLPKNHQKQVASTSPGYAPKYEKPLVAQDVDNTVDVDRGDLLKVITFMKEKCEGSKSQVWKTLKNFQQPERIVWMKNQTKQYMFTKKIDEFSDEIMTAIAIQLIEVVNPSAKITYQSADQIRDTVLYG